MKASNLFGKQIESKDKKIHGYIIAICRADKSIDGYICCDQNEKEFFVLANDVKFLRGKAVFLRTAKKNKNAARLRLGKPLFGAEGKFLGIVDDYTLQGASITFAHAANKKYDYNNLTDGDAVILNDSSARTELFAKDLMIDAMIKG